MGIYQYMENHSYIVFRYRTAHNFDFPVDSIYIKLLIMNLINVCIELGRASLTTLSFQRLRNPAMLSPTNRNSADLVGLGDQIFNHVQFLKSNLKDDRGESFWEI